MKNEKKFLKIYKTALVFFAVLICFLGWGFRVNAVSMKLNKTSATLRVGKSIQLKVKNASKKVKWASSNKSVAIVTSKGKVTAKKKGVATITAQAGKKKFCCKVKVKAAETALSAAAMEINYGESKVLTLLNPQGKAAWFSSNKKIAFADGEKVYAKSVGQAKITAKCNGISYQCKITVLSGEDETIDENGIYTSKDKVASYLHIYGKLPKNFITKKEANELGWKGGSLIPYAPYSCIGGDYFGNYEKKLPAEKGREYHECDIDTLGALSRGAKRIVYSNDGLVYYTKDHYENFVKLY